MFGTWIVRLGNPIWACKLDGIVISLSSVICTWSQGNVIPVWNQLIMEGLCLQIFVGFYYCELQGQEIADK